MSTTPLLAIEHLGVRYRHRQTDWAAGDGVLEALQDVSIAMAPGGRLGIVGESGSGKSTLARVILGFVPASAGRVVWDGVPVDYANKNQVRQLRRQLQVVFQDPFSSLDPRMTAGECVAEALHASGADLPVKAKQERVDNALREVGLDTAFSDRYPHELSGGQCQRVAIARATIVRPRLLICDEAVSALDVSVQAQIVNLLRELSERHQMALLFISHNLAVVRHLCSDIAVLCKGRLVEQGGRAAIFSNPKDPYTRELLAAVPEPDPRLYR